jgi:hypothetical protein
MRPTGRFKSFALALEDLNKRGDAACPTPRPPLARLAHDDCDHSRLRAGQCPRSAPELLGRANGHHRYPDQHWWIFEGGNRPSRWFDLRRVGWRPRCNPAARLHADHSWPRPRRRHNAARSAHRLRAALPHRACHRGHRAAEQRRPDVGPVRLRAEPRPGDYARVRGRRSGVRAHRPARAHAHLCQAAAETAVLLAEIMTALEPAVRTGAPDLGKLPTRVRATLDSLSTAAQEAAHERRSRLSDHPDPEPLFRTLRRLQQDILALDRMFDAPWPDRVHAALAPPWSAYAKAAAAELCALAAALPSRNPPPDSSAARTAMADFIAAIDTIREEGITRALPTDVLGRILGSAFAAEQLQRDLDDFVERTRGVTTWTR